jgi:hypothetical protein
MTTQSPAWRKSSYSASNGACVAVADLGDRVGIRNSNHPTRATLELAPAAVAAFVADCAAGQLDDLA